MKITTKHHFLIFLLLLLVIVWIKSYTSAGKSKQSSSTPKAIVQEQNSSSRIELVNESREADKNMLPPAPKVEYTERKNSGREDPFEPLINSSPKIVTSSNDLDNREEVNLNKGHSPLVRLVGIIADATPVAILEVDNISYIMSIGDIVAGMEMAEIRSDEIVLIVDGEERTIKLAGE